MALVTKAAWAESATNMRSTVEGNLNLMKDAYNITQSYTSAAQLLHPMTMMQNVLSSAKDKASVD